MEFSGTIMSFASSDPIEIRGVKTVYIQGRSRTTEVTKAVVYGAAQPATPDVLERVPEGYKNQNVLTFYIGRIVSEDLEEIQIENGDVIFYRGSKYKVFELSGWNHIGDYTEVSAVKEIK
jgi:hypothetical protein